MNFFVLVTFVLKHSFFKKLIYDDGQETSVSELYNVTTAPPQFILP